MRIEHRNTDVDLDIHLVIGSPQAGVILMSRLTLVPYSSGAAAKAP